MDRTRTKRFFSDIVPEAIIMNPRHKPKPDPDVDLSELMWEVFTSRGESAEADAVADEYADYPETRYISEELKDWLEEYSDE